MAAECIIHTRGRHLLQCQDLSPECTTDTSQKCEPATGNRSSPSETSVNPATSTPLKREDRPIIDQDNPAWSTAMQLTDETDLIGPVLTLPENTDPYQVLAATYAQLYEYCGDALAGRLHFVTPNRYVRRRKEAPRVTFDDEHSHKTGEQLLREFLDMPYPVAMDTAQVKSENQSADGTVDMDYDEKSERSERSSRSERSHSDESLSFLGDDADLTVRATVSDPSLGIKLTITKRPKVKIPSPELGHGRREEGVRRSSRETVASVFDSSFRRTTRASFSFRFHTLDVREMCRPQVCLLPRVSDTVFSRLSARVKPYGRRRCWKGRSSLPRCSVVHSGIQTML